MHIFHCKKGVSLVEVLISAFVLVVVSIIFLQGYISCIKLAAISKESLFALNSASAKIEEIRNHNFDDIYSDYYLGSDRTFSVAEFNPNDSMGTVFIDNTNPEMLRVIIAICWRHMDGRIIGEDTNLDGVLQASEDTDSDSRIDSPITVATNIIRP